MADVPDWLVNWSRTMSLWDILLWVAGAAAFVLFVKKGWPALKRFAVALNAFVKTVDAVTGLHAFIERTDATLKAQDARIAEIHHETHRNDGSSIKDSSDRTEAAVERVELGVRGLYDRVGLLETSLEGVHGRLDEVGRDLTALHQEDESLRTDAEQLRKDFDDTIPNDQLPKENP